MHSSGKEELLNGKERELAWLQQYFQEHREFKHILGLQLENQLAFHVFKAAQCIFLTHNSRGLRKIVFCSYKKSPRLVLCQQKKV